MIAGACTVVVRWAVGAPTRVLALRDELTGRHIDAPGAWWPDSPIVAGGGDRAGGGTRCATRVATGVTALVLNRPRKPDAEPGAQPRGARRTTPRARGWSPPGRPEDRSHSRLLRRIPDADRRFPRPDGVGARPRRQAARRTSPAGTPQAAANA